MFKKRRNLNPEAPGPSIVANGEDDLGGIADLAQGENEEGVPFILVDCAPCTTRSELDAALSEVENKRMQDLVEDVELNNLEKLEDVSPPPELDMPVNLGINDLANLKAIEDEESFQEDMRSLCIASLEEETKILQHTTSNLELLRSKLEKLKSLQDTVILSEIDEKTSPATPPQNPGIRRQATFDVKREKGSGIVQREIKSTTDIVINPRLPGIRKVASTSEQIIRKIGDLLMQLQVQQDGCEVLEEGSSHSYLVTISPADNLSNCSIKAITDLKTANRKVVVPPQNRGLSHLPLPRTPAITIHSAPERKSNRPRLSMNSLKIDVFSSGGNSHFPKAAPLNISESSSSRTKSPYMRKRPGTYLKVPSPARYCHGRKRD
ncbi:hypothetical protein KR009_002917 [Drosophila setifemur]|nr:hypothetical protein KR009_002917 [Drosophila setifemur]